MKAAIVILTFLISSYGSAMDVQEVIRNMQKVYAQKELEYKCNYTLFKGHSTDEVYQSYNGYIYKSQGMLYQKINQTEQVYAKDFALEIDQDEKTISMGNAIQLPEVNFNLDAIFNECDKKLLEVKGNYYEVKLILKATSSLPFSEIVLNINKENFQLIQMDMYYSIVQDFSEKSRQEDLQYPHLKISMSHFTASPVRQDALFLLSTYVKKAGNTDTPSEKYTGYTILKLN